MKILKILTNAFPIWLIIFSALALIHPTAFTWFNGPLITMGLGIIMLGMGLTLTFDDFRRVLALPKWVFTGVGLQFCVMPSLGWGISVLWGLPPPLAAGLILVSCCPGGTASNVISFLAEANVALSVTMTAVSTTIAIGATPFLTAVLVGNRVEVNAWGLLMSTLQVVFLPLVLGVFINRYAKRVAATILPAAPFVAVVFIVLIVASIIGQGKQYILEAGFSLLGAVFMLHLAGFVFGYILSRLALRDEKLARTVSIEVGMQNSGLGVVLARQNFPNPLVAIPSAISSVFHSLIGSLFAAYWRANPTPKGLKRNEI